MTRVYVIRGRQQRGVDAATTDQWHYYGAGIIVSLTLLTPALAGPADQSPPIIPITRNRLTIVDAHAYEVDRVFTQQGRTRR